MNPSFTLRAAALIAALALAACAQQVRLEDAPVDGADSANSSSVDGARSGQVPGGSISGSSLGSERAVAQVNVDPSRDPMNDPNNPLSKRSIYFDFDSFTIRDDFRSAIDAHARYLNANKGRKVVIQGNTDERGSREYNLALGQKRAEAVRRALSALGVSESQMEAVSLGEEKPRATSGDESAQAENRRADLVYQ